MNFIRPEQLDILTSTPFGLHLVAAAAKRRGLGTPVDSQVTTKTKSPIHPEIREAFFLSFPPWLYIVPSVRSVVETRMTSR